jgi:hypothetical protein
MVFSSFLEEQPLCCACLFHRPRIAYANGHFRRCAELQNLPSKLEILMLTAVLTPLGTANATSMICMQMPMVARLSTGLGSTPEIKLATSKSHHSKHSIMQLGNPKVMYSPHPCTNIALSWTCTSYDSIRRCWRHCGISMLHTAVHCTGFASRFLGSAPSRHAPLRSDIPKVGPRGMPYT